MVQIYNNDKTALVNFTIISYPSNYFKIQEKKFLYEIIPKFAPG